MENINFHLEAEKLLAKTKEPAKPSILQEKFKKFTSGEWFAKEEEKGCCPSLSRTERIIAFVICFSLGLLFFGLSMMLLPVLLFKARKFALFFTLGSLFMIFSFASFRGPLNHLKHLFSSERRVFSCYYFGTLFLTLYFAMVAKSTVFTVLFAVLQVVALLWFLITFTPGGYTGLKFFGQLGRSSVSSSMSSVLPI